MSRIISRWRCSLRLRTCPSSLCLNTELYLRRHTGRVSDAINLLSQMLKKKKPKQLYWQLRIHQVVLLMERGEVLISLLWKTYHVPVLKLAFSFDLFLIWFPNINFAFHTVLPYNVVLLPGRRQTKCDFPGGLRRADFWCNAHVEDDFWLSTDTFCSWKNRALSAFNHLLQHMKQDTIQLPTRPTCESIWKWQVSKPYLKSAASKTLRIWRWNLYFKKNLESVLTQVGHYLTMRTSQQYNQFQQHNGESYNIF